MRAAIGAAIVAAHAAGFAVLAERCRGTELAVELDAPLASPRLALDGTVPAALADRVAVDVAPTAPGLVRKTWRVDYRGGYTRAVGATQLVGPFQDPASRACTGRVIVGQRLLDDGHASPGTIAGEMAEALDAVLRGQSFLGAGDFQRIADLALRWTHIASHPSDFMLVGMAPWGYVRATATVKFDRVDVPLVVVLVPEPADDALRFRIAARAELAFGNRVFQWLSDKLGGNELVTGLARRQIDETLVTALAPPPPFELPDGQRITFRYCAAPPEIVDGAWGALPFGIAIDRAPGAPAVLPPRRGPAPHAPVSPTTGLAIDLDLDALDALLFELWRSGFLDRRLAEAGLDRRFNSDPVVTEYLAIRMSPVRLALPPVLSPTPTGLRLGAEARVAITDGARTTTGRVWGGLDFTFGRDIAALAVDLGALELSCERTPTTLVPCYADLVAAIRDRGAEFHGALTRTFAELLADIFVDRRLGGVGLPADLVIRAARPSVHGTTGNASLRLELDAALERAR